MFGSDIGAFGLVNGVQRLTEKLKVGEASREQAIEEVHGLRDANLKMDAELRQKLGDNVELSDARLGGVRSAMNATAGLTDGGGITG